ncbi:MAG TPA: HEAT repeat domain-containing protein [Terriglobales bacterium]|nr:HEAT repeat domain-containing protein [Terriglobales bacterium]
MDNNQLPDSADADVQSNASTDDALPAVVPDMGIERNTRPRINLRRVAVLVVMMSAVGLLAIRSGAMQAILEIFTGHQLPVAGLPVAATHSKLSEHEIEYINSRPPQEQMERLLSAAVNHDIGATEMIKEKVAGWHGHLARSKQWQVLSDTALYSNDLRVRAAAIEVELAVNNVDKSRETAMGLWRTGEDNVKSRPFSAWELGMLANRGVAPDLVQEWLESWVHDPDQQTRFWSVEGLAHIGTDSTIKDFLDVLRNDPSMEVRERAGCSLAKSGMLTREQRIKAVPGLIDLSDDPNLNDITRTWVYQALREITDVNLPNDPAAWRNWYSQHGAEQVEKFKSEGNAVLGNS